MNAGSNALVLPHDTLDLAGHARIQEGRVDIGAYESSAPFLLTAPQALAPCASQSNGAVLLQVEGSACAPFSYKWTSSAGTTGTGITGLASGTYSFTLTDKRGSTLVFGVIIPDTLSIGSAQITQASSASSADGSIAIAAQNGTPPYEALWSNDKSGLQITGLAPGMYTVTLTDQNGCRVVAVYQVKFTSDLQEPALTPAQALGGPASDLLTVRMPALVSGAMFRFALTDALGRTLREVSLPDLETHVDVSDLTAGLYFWRLIVHGDIVQSGEVVKKR